MRRILAIVGLLCLISMPALAVYTDPPLPDPAQEARARALMRSLRCLVCQNQSIHDSNAPLARDLRTLVRERIAAGDSDEAAVQYLVDRYGDWVLLEPPFKATTLVLWIGPAVLFVLAVIAVVAFQRRQRAEASAGAPLSSQEQAELDRLLQDRNDG